MEPRVVAFANGSLGAYVIQHIQERLVGVVLHPDEQDRDADLIKKVIPNGVPVFKGRPDDSMTEWIQQLAPTHGVSILYGYILQESVRVLFSHGIANLHTSYLPWGRGAHPNAWAILEDHPVGITLHLIDGGVDTGPILFQELSYLRNDDDALSLYRRLMLLAEEKLPSWLRSFLSGCAASPQPDATVVTRRVKELYPHLTINADDHYQVRDLLKILRAGTFPPHPGVIYRQNGKTFRLRIQIEEEGAE